MRWPWGLKDPTAAYRSGWLDLRAFGMDEDKDFAVTDLVTTKPILEKVTSGDAGVLELTLILEAHEHYILSIR